MKKTILRTFFVCCAGVLLFSCSKDNEATSDKDIKIVFGDSAFEAALYDAGVDANGDGVITRSETEVVKGLDLSQYAQSVDISSVDEIRYFDAIESLNISSTGISTIDLSHNTLLKSFTAVDCPNFTSFVYCSTVDIDLWIYNGGAVTATPATPAGGSGDSGDADDSDDAGDSGSGDLAEQGGADDAEDANPGGDVVKPNEGEDADDAEDGDDTVYPDDETYTNEDLKPGVNLVM